MDRIFPESGVRFIVGEPHGALGTQGFAEQVLRNAEVRGALTPDRSRLRHIRALPVLDIEDDRDHFGEVEAVFYDYARNRAVIVTGAPGGRPPYQIRTTHEQPAPSNEEFSDAVSLVAASPVWGPLLQSGHLTASRPMPPALESADGEPVERTLYVALHSDARKFHRFVAVNMVQRTVSREAVQPRGATARDITCGAQPGICV